MKKLKMNFLAHLVVLTGFIFGVVLFPFIKTVSGNTILHTELLDPVMMNSLMSNNHQYLDLTLKPEFTPQTTKFVPGIKLNTYQAHAYRKSSSEKSKLLHHILNNAEKRRKFKYVMKKASELKLPNDLALIPVIESEYKNKAVSSAGAAGPWQLMSGTARILGISSRQRFEMAASTKAALLHLKDLYKEYGNWELAIAAYNAGDGRVNQALSRNPHAKTVQELRLPHETRQYVVAFFQLQKALKSYDLT